MAKDISRYTIRTSDRRSFRRCLRKWGFHSSLRMNLQRRGTEQNMNFWFGTAIHYAMEDYFGYNRFGDPRRAFAAYYDCFEESTRPENHELMYDLGIAMLTYFLPWYEKHNRLYDFQTLWLNDKMEQVEPHSPGAKPAVEQEFYLDLNIKVILDRHDNVLCEYSPALDARIKTEQVAYDFTGKEDESETQATYFEVTPGNWVPVQIMPIHYHGTLDRLVVDKYGRWWILDYKTAKGADTNKLDTDDQISAYLWAAQVWFKRPIYGFIYLQMTKEAPHPPKRLKDSSLSSDKKQKTTHFLAREAIIADYGSVQKAPNKYIEFLNNLAEKETPEGDRFVRWDFVQRSQNQLTATYNHIIAETRAMLNPNIYLFPNPTRDCIWDCSLRAACLAMDDGRQEEVNALINTDYEMRPRGINRNAGDKWQDRLKYPDEPQTLADESEFAINREDSLEAIMANMFGEDYDE